MLTLLACLPLSAAEEPKAAEGIDHSIPVAELAVQTRPMRKEQLEKLLEEWMGALELQATQTADAIIKVKSGGLSEEEAKKWKAIEKESHEKELEIAKRLKVVIKSLEQKGGDVEQAKKYALAITNPSESSGSGGKLKTFGGVVSNWFKDPSGGGAFLTNLLTAVAILIGFWFLSKLATRLVKKGFTEKVHVSRILRDFVIRFVGGLVMLIGVLVAISSLGIGVGPMMAALGAGGFILGFALQETLGNFASGMMIMVYQPFDEGDFVELAGVSGKVEKMSLVSTTLLTLDNKELIIPNKKAWGETITNYTGRDIRRVDLVFGIGYGDDIDQATKVLREVAEAHNLVLEDPGVTVGVHSLGDSSVNLFLRPWSKTLNYWDVYWDLTKTAKQRFDEEGITIPFPQRDVHMHQVGSES